MRRINRFGVGVLVLCCFTLVGVSFANPPLQQKPSDPAAESNERFEHMSKQLNLTADQKPKVKAIVEQQAVQWAVLSRNKTLNGKQKIAKMQEINQDTQQRIDKILTPQQRQKLQAIMEESRPKPGRPAGKPGKRPPENE